MSLRRRRKASLMVSMPSLRDTDLNHPYLPREKVQHEELYMIPSTKYQDVRAGEKVLLEEPDATPSINGPYRIISPDENYVATPDLTVSSAANSIQQRTGVTLVDNPVPTLDPSPDSKKKKQGKKNLSAVFFKLKAIFLFANHYKVKKK